MICPGCRTQNEMAYSSLSNGFFCLQAECGFEVEMSLDEASELIEPIEELVCA
jgi:hypothetical protein